MAAGSLRSTTQNVQLARVGIDKIVTLGPTRQEARYLGYCAEVPDNHQEYYLIQQMTNLPAAQATQEGTGIEIFGFQTPFQQQVYKTKYALALAFTTETLERDPYNVWKNPGAKMRDAHMKAMSGLYSGFWNLGTTSLTTPDGQPLFSSTHIIQNGTFSNLIASSAALSALALEQGVQDIRQQPDWFGDPVFFTGSMALVVPPALEMLANRIVRSTQLAQTNDNDPNYVASTVDRVIVDPWITSTTGWGLVPVAGTDNPLKRMTERAPRVDENVAYMNDSHVYTSTSIFTLFAETPYNVGYSAGA